MTTQVYADGETRPLGQEVVLLHKDTYAVRLFPSESAARAYFPSLFAVKRRCVFTGERQLVETFTVTQLKTHLRELTTRPEVPTFSARDRAPECPDHDPSSASSVASALWRVLQLVGDRVLGAPGSGKSKVDDSFKFDETALTSPEGRQAWGALPKQARQILTEVVALAEYRVTEKRAREIMVGLVSRGVMRTKQDPMRVWAFYMPTMADMGLVEYPGRRVRRQDEDEPELAEAAE